MPFVSHVILTLFGNRYEVLCFRCGFHRVTDTRGRPTTGVRGGEIIVDVESTSDVSAHENIFEYGFPRSAPGSLEVWNRDETHCFRRIKWSEAYIFEVGEAMARHGWEPMTMRLAITPLRLDFDHTIRIDRRWPETYGIWWEKYKPKEKAKPYVRPEEHTEKRIKKLYWIDAETKEEIDTIKSNQKVRLCFETQGYRKGEKVRARIKWDDDRLFANKSTAIMFSGIVDENGRATSDETYEMKDIDN